MAPRILAISGDSVEMIEKFYAAFEALGCEATHLAFFRKPFRASLPLAGFEKHLLAQHAIFVGGGNTKSALAVWREWGLDVVFRKAWLAGTLLCGMSAGALCWFEQGLTDSYWGAGLQPLDCLGVLPGACCVHYSGEAERRKRLHEEIASGALGHCVAIDDCAAVLYAGTAPSAVLSWRSGATAHQVFMRGPRVVEMPLEARSIA